MLSPDRAQRLGFTLVEAMTAVVIATVACSAMLLAVNQSIEASSGAMVASRANLLAEDLMNEIGSMKWVDATDPAHWGPESSEMNPQNTRVAFNDIDDYDAWVGTPQTRNGQTYDSLQKSLFPSVTSQDYALFACSVHVDCVSSAGAVVPHDQTSSRRVTIQVTWDSRPVATLARTFQSANSMSLLGSQHWQDAALAEPIAPVQTVP